MRRAPIVLYLVHAHARTLNHEHHWRAALAKRFDLRVLSFSPSAGSDDLASALESHPDATLVAFALKLRFVPAPLHLPPPLAPRILIEPDAFLNFCDGLSGSRNLLGRVERIYAEGRFRCVMTRDDFSANRLRSRGIPAVWIPHAVDPTVFGARMCSRTVPAVFVGSTSPTMYPERQRIVRILTERVPGAQVFDETARLGTAAYAALLARTHLFVSTSIDPGGQAHKTEAKLFEAMASGCCVLRRPTVELERLGFRPDVHYVPFESVEDLPTLIEAYSRSPQRMSSIANRARELVRHRHTWAQRAKLAARLLAAKLGTQP